MTEHDRQHQVEDLDVPQSDADEVKGGSLNFALKLSPSEGVKKANIDLGSAPGSWSWRG